MYASCEKPKSIYDCYLLVRTRQSNFQYRIYGWMDVKSTRADTGSIIKLIIKLPEADSEENS